LQVKQPNIEFATLLQSSFWLACAPSSDIPVPKKDVSFTMYSGLLMILLQLIAGYLIPLHRRQQLKYINQLLSLMIYVILFFMGISLAFIADISSNLLLIF